MVANVLKFINLMSGKVNSKKGESSQSYKTDELHRADLMLLRQAQRESFARELENLTDSKSITKNSHLVKLSPLWSNLHQTAIKVRSLLLCQC